MYASGPASTAAVMTPGPKTTVAPSWGRTWGTAGISRSSAPHTNGSTGTIRVQVLRATHAQLRRVRELIDQNPGSFQLTLEVGSNGSTMRYDTSYRVSDGPWVTELRRTHDLGFVHVMRHRDAFAKHVETAQV